MEIVNLMNKQNALECEVAELKRKFHAVKAEADGILECKAEADIDRFNMMSEWFGADVKAFGGEHGKLLSARSQRLYRKLYDGAKGGEDVERVIYRDDFGLDVTSIKIEFKIVVENGNAVVVGGELHGKEIDDVSSVLITESHLIYGPEEEYLNECRTVYDFKILDADFLGLAILGFFRREFARLCKEKNGK